MCSVLSCFIFSNLFKFATKSGFFVDYYLKHFTNIVLVNVFSLSVFFFFEKYVTEFLLKFNWFGLLFWVNNQKSHTLLAQPVYMVAILFINITLIQLILI